MACPCAPIGLRVALSAPAAALHSAASAAIAQALRHTKAIHIKQKASHFLKN